MPIERKKLASYTGAAIGGHASHISFVKDEAGRLEVTIGGGANPAHAILSDEDAKALVGVLKDEFGITAPEAVKKPAAPAPHPSSQTGGMSTKETKSG